MAIENNEAGHMFVVLVLTCLGKTETGCTPAQPSIATLAWGISLLDLTNTLLVSMKANLHQVTFQEQLNKYYAAEVVQHIY